MFLKAMHPIFSVTANCGARNDLRVTVDSHFSPELNNIPRDQIDEKQGKFFYAAFHEISSLWEPL